MNVRPFKFSTSATEIKPDTQQTCLLESYGENDLTRAAKNQISNITSCRGSYKLSGWEWPMWTVLPRFLVSMNYDPGTFHTYYAPDKTSLRFHLRGKVREIITAPERRFRV
jgi:hypothetical protein